MRLLSRRTFLRRGAAAGGGLLIYVGCRDSMNSSDHEPGFGADDSGGDGSGAGEIELDAYVSVDTTGIVTIRAPCPEIGQGVRTSLAMIVADEMGADWSRVRVRQAPADSRYGGMTVAGSDSVADYWEPLRLAGATAREALRAAAADHWGVPLEECRVHGGRISHGSGRRTAGFGELAEAAARAVDRIASPPLKGPEEFELIGSSVTSVDARAVTVGGARFGIDVRVPGMRFAVVARPPVPGARPLAFDRDRAMAIDGVLDVLSVDPLVLGGRMYGAVRPGVAVVAETTWAAMRGRDELDVTWDRDADAGLSSAGIRRRMRARLDSPADAVIRGAGEDGDPSPGAETVEAVYELPPLAHAPMEPPNFTADCRADGARLWGPTQDPRHLQALVSAGLDLPPEVVSVQPTLAGGGFGRRLAVDYGVEAAVISCAAGVPVQVFWSREDDMRHDYYRTPSAHLLRAELDRGGGVASWYHHVVSSPLVDHLQDAWTRDPATPAALYDVQGAADLPYSIRKIRVEHSSVGLGLQLGSWRSVSHSFNVFAVESFVDELALATGSDPGAFRLALLGEDRVADIRLPLPGRRGNPRPDVGLLRRVVEMALRRSDWGSPVPDTWGRGVACCYYKSSYAAHVAEVAMEGNRPRVKRIVAALDCGRVVNPSGVEAQVEGAAMDGTATVLHWGIEIEDGRVIQSNFADHPLLRISEAPDVEVHLVPSDRPPSGAGEPPYPSVAPAIANAIFAASGSRPRRLPIGPPGSVDTR